MIDPFFNLSSNSKELLRTLSQLAPEMEAPSNVSLASALFFHPIPWLFIFNIPSAYSKCHKRNIIIEKKKIKNQTIRTPLYFPPNFIFPNCTTSVSAILQII
jgi:hypothetical protein